MRSTICIAEDRQTCEPAVKLLVLSLNNHCPERVVSLFYPPANDGFLTWIKKFPQVRLQTARLENGYGWNVKPQAIMQLLDEGFDEVIWVDSDVLVTRNLLPLFSGLKHDVFVATEHTLAEERRDPNALRARLWGLSVGRVLPLALSSGVFRATRDHYDLMTRWWELLGAGKYQECQKKPWKQRPIHMLGDQDVLTALLTSKEFSHFPIQVLRRGKHIIQFDGVYGYTVAERIRNLLGDGPSFVHSGASKPWIEQWRLESSGGLREYIKMVYLDLAPFTLSSLRFRRELECNTEWMEPHYKLSVFLRALGLGYPPLVGLPMAVFADLARILKYILKPRHLSLSPVEAGELEAAGKR
jgi:hypothetical protein